ncbi:hypothetical protein BS47DRAFT_1300050 [Hydnum rufescens UP504]|uniref:Uncharacterized protein n=1 Tax=Hydnum rufescens UP504 TaxID=1448309 RepID=A0A9P6DTH4_9AGAM|nr:hypothetical protein BS47DRAFT_1300050 [Hydnum rufescens UP504]
MRSPSHFTQDNRVVEGLFGVLGKENPGDSSCKASTHGTKRTANEGTDYYADHPEDDTVEPGLHALNSTYDACRQSFIAADEDRVKASTQYFEDTGVIALLCRHDIPLAVASMWTAGEKQFYVFATVGDHPEARTESLENWGPV